MCGKRIKTAVFAVIAIVVCFVATLVLASCFNHVVYPPADQKDTSVNTSSDNGAPVSSQGGTIVLPPDVFD